MTDEQAARAKVHAMCEWPTEAYTASEAFMAKQNAALDEYRDAVARAILTFREENHPGYGPCDGFGVRGFPGESDRSVCSKCVQVWIMAARGAETPRE